MTSTIQPFLLCVIPAPVDDSGNPCAGNDLAERGQHTVQTAGNIDRSACQHPLQRLSCNDFQEIYGHIVKKHCGDDRCVFSCCINIRPLAEQKISDIAFTVDSGVDNCFIFLASADASLGFFSKIPFSFA